MFLCLLRGRGKDKSKGDCARRSLLFLFIACSSVLCTFSYHGISHYTSIRVSYFCQPDWFLIFPGVTLYIFDKAGHNPADRSTKSEWKYDDRFWLIN
jgi:hypothetical protein